MSLIFTEHSALIFAVTCSSIADIKGRFSNAPAFGYAVHPLNLLDFY